MNRPYRFNIQGDCYSVTKQHSTRFESLTPYQTPVLPIQGSRRTGASRKSEGGALFCLSSKYPHGARCKICNSPLLQRGVCLRDAITFMKTDGEFSCDYPDIKRLILKPRLTRRS